MTEKSSIFDNIRIKSRRGAKVVKDVPDCTWEDCDKPGPHKAPKSHRPTGEFHNFCLEHVRQYNKSFNFFTQDDKNKELSKEALHRAALSGEKINFAASGKPKVAKTRRVSSADSARIDPQNLYARLAARSRAKTGDAKPLKRLMPADRTALEALGLKGQQTSKKIKTTYKELVKIHHPDANGGDKSSEERLRVIITAYTHLKQRGFL